jgi:hypothetical protein
MKPQPYSPLPQQYIVAFGVPHYRDTWEVLIRRWGLPHGTPHGVVEWLRVGRGYLPIWSSPDPNESKPDWVRRFAPFTLTQVVLTSPTGSNQTYNVPSDWTSTNTIECWGAGAGGQAHNAVLLSGAGGGGGYSSITNYASLTPGGTATYRIGTGGHGDNGSAGAVAGGNTWFNNTVFGNPVGAQGGQIGGTTAGGLGGAAASGFGTVTNSGGPGGNGAATQSGPGGGAAASSAGTGGTGVNGAAAAANGGKGGDSPSAGAGGAGGTSSGANGVAGTDNQAGGGGGGGGWSDAGGTAASGNGAIGGLPGGGGGAGGQIVLTYTPPVGWPAGNTVVMY